MRWNGGAVERWSGLLLALVLSASSRASAQDIDEGREALRTGKYQEAIAQLLKVSASDTQWVDAQRYLVRAYATIGKYDGMHLGHQRILDAVLAEAAQRALPSLVILSEPQPEEFFAGTDAPPRLNHFQDKVDVLDAYGIDAVYRMRFDEALSQQPAEAFTQS